MESPAYWSTKWGSSLVMKILLKKASKDSPLSTNTNTFIISKESLV